MNECCCLIPLGARVMRAYRVRSLEVTNIIVNFYYSFFLAHFHAVSRSTSFFSSCHMHAQSLTHAHATH